MVLVSFYVHQIWKRSETKLKHGESRFPKSWKWHPLKYLKICFLNMEFFLFDFWFFNLGLMSSVFSPQTGRQKKLTFEIWTQTKHFSLAPGSRSRGFMNNAFPDLHDKITHIAYSKKAWQLHSLSAQICVSMSVGCYPVLKIIWADKISEGSGDRHLRCWLVHLALTTTLRAMSIFFLPSHSFLCCCLLKVHFTERRAFLLVLHLN